MKNVPKFYTHYNKPVAKKLELDTDTVFVSQSEAQVASLSYQLSRYGMDGLQARLDSMKEKFGYADVTKCNDFREMQNRVRSGIEYFEKLPAEVRRQFGDRAENFYDYISKNPEQAKKDGYINPSVSDVVKTVDVQKGQEIVKDEVKSDVKVEQSGAI